jgi:predicted nucleic acid-binding protein
MTTETAVNHYVLDACGLIAFFNDEQGAEKVEQLFNQAGEGKVELYAHAINLYEVYYDALRHGSSEKAEELLGDLYHLPITIVENLDRPLMRLAAQFKINHRMSVADSFALALAAQLNAFLISTDHHEFDAVEKTGATKFFWLR